MAVRRLFGPAGRLYALHFEHYQDNLNCVRESLS